MVTHLIEACFNSHFSQDLGIPLMQRSQFIFCVNELSVSRVDLSVSGAPLPLLPGKNEFWKDWLLFKWITCVKQLLHNMYFSQKGEKLSVFFFSVKTLCQDGRTDEVCLSSNRSSHGLSQQGVWVPFWTPKPLKITPQDIQFFCVEFLKISISSL